MAWKENKEGKIQSPTNRGSFSDSLYSLLHSKGDTNWGGGGNKDEYDFEFLQFFIAPQSKICSLVLKKA